MAQTSLTITKNKTSVLKSQGDSPSHPSVSGVLLPGGGSGVCDTQTAGGLEGLSHLAGIRSSTLAKSWTANRRGGGASPSLLDDASISARQLRNSKDARTKRNRRCFHRAMSGLQRGGNIRFLTLTSTPQSVDIHRHFKALTMRLKRRGLLTGYIQVPAYTDSGLVHKHILFRGSYIEQRLISRWWNDLHDAPVVDIRVVRGNKRKIAGYMASYMSNQSAGHYSWDWGWVWRGFVKDWERLKHCWQCARHGWDEFSPTLTGLPRWDMSFASLLGQWRWHLETGIPP